MKNFKDDGFMIEADAVWAKSDLPLNERVAQSVVFGAKHLMSKWGESKSSVWVDVGDHLFWFDGQLALKAEVDNQTLKVSYEPG